MRLIVFFVRRPRRENKNALGKKIVTRSARTRPKTVLGSITQTRVKPRRIIMNKAENKELPRLLRVKDVALMLGMSKASVWRKVRVEKDFPKNFRLSAKMTCWSEREVLDYIKNLPRKN